MKLFDDFEVVRFPEENLIYVTQREYIWYIYNPEYKIWRKQKNPGNDKITVSNYPDVSKEELKHAMGGIFPVKETDFMRLCHPSELSMRNLLDLLIEDHGHFMSDAAIYDAAYDFLSESVILYKSHEKLKKLFEDAIALQQDNGEVLIRIKELCLAVIGRDIFKKEIGIVDGHNCSSYFWIMPVRVIDLVNTHDWDNVAEMRDAEISIELDDVAQYLEPFLLKHFDEELEANKKRVCETWTDDDGTEQISYYEGFEWYLTHNFYTFDSMTKILNDIRDTMDALSSGRENEWTRALREKRGRATYQLLYSKNLTQEQVDEYNANRPKEDDTEPELIIDFYRRFIYRMEYMMTVGKEKGFNLISVMGP